MAKKSKIAQNEKRRVTVARYAARRAELKEIMRNPRTGSGNGGRPPRSCGASRATPVPRASATGMPWTGGPEGIYGSSGSPGSGCASRRTPVFCRA